MHHRIQVPVEVIERQLCLPFLPEEVDEQRGVSHALVCALLIDGHEGAGQRRKEKKTVGEKIIEMTLQLGAVH